MTNFALTCAAPLLLLLYCLVGAAFGQDEPPLQNTTTAEAPLNTTTVAPWMPSQTNNTYAEYCLFTGLICREQHYEFCNLKTYRCECVPGASYNRSATACQLCTHMNYYTCPTCCPQRGYECSFAGDCTLIVPPTYWPSPEPEPITQPMRLSTPFVVVLVVVVIAMAIFSILWRCFCRNLSVMSCCESSAHLPNHPYQVGILDAMPPHNHDTARIAAPVATAPAYESRPHDAHRTNVVDASFYAQPPPIEVRNIIETSPHAPPMRRPPIGVSSAAKSRTQADADVDLPPTYEEATDASMLAIKGDVAQRVQSP